MVTDSGYRFVCEIARGGMGRVELVLRSEGGFTRLYARKRLLAALVDDESSRAMFLDESRIAGTLRHPNIVSVHDVGEDEEGLFLIMDYVEGVPATDLITRSRRAGEHLPVQAVVRIVQQAAEGLHAAHEAVGLDGAPLEIVHRDISPSNLLVDLHGVVRVADFGIARAAGRQAKTSTGLLKGKVGYLAPELLRFRRPDRRADLYSLGVVLYELLNGRRLYAGKEISEVARRVLDEPAPDLGADRNDVPDALVELGFELLAKDPAHRPATAREVSLRLEAILQDLLLVEEPLDFPAWVRAWVDEEAISRRRAQAEEVRNAPAAPPAARTSRRALVAAVAIAGATALVLAGWALSEPPQEPATLPAVAAPPSRGGSAMAAAGNPTRSELAEALEVGAEPSEGTPSEPAPATPAAPAEPAAGGMGAEAGTVDATEEPAVSRRSARRRRLRRRAAAGRAEGATEGNAEGGRASMQDRSSLEPWGWE